jgi:hypothetical protein
VHNNLSQRPATTHVAPGVVFVIIYRRKYAENAVTLMQQNQPVHGIN